MRRKKKYSLNWQSSAKEIRNENSHVLQQTLQSISFFKALILNDDKKKEKKRIFYFAA